MLFMLINMLKRVLKLFPKNQKEKVNFQMLMQKKDQNIYKIL